MLMANNDQQSIIISSILSNVSHMKSKNAIITGTCPPGYFVSAVLHNGSLRCGKYVSPQSIKPYNNDSTVSVYGDGLIYRTSKSDHISIDYTRVQRRSSTSQCMDNFLMSGTYIRMDP